MTNGLWGKHERPPRGYGSLFVRAPKGTRTRRIDRWAGGLAPAPFRDGGVAVGTVVIAEFISGCAFRATPQGGRTHGDVGRDSLLGEEALPPGWFRF